jgi:hypothetical protein
VPGWPNGSGGCLQSSYIWVQLPSPAPILNPYTQKILPSPEEFVCKVAGNVEEAKALIESGFEYVTEVDSVKLFRKRK